MEPYEEVVRKHGALVLRVCRAMLPTADADDAWTETFLAAMQGYARLPADSNVTGWLVTIAHRKAIDQLRATARRAMPVGDAPETPSTDADQSLDPDLRAALVALPPKQQVAVIGRYLADLPYRDLARMLDSSEAAARRAAADGIAALRSRFGTVPRDD